MSKDVDPDVGPYFFLIVGICLLGLFSAFFIYRFCSFGSGRNLFLLILTSFLFLLLLGVTLYCRLKK